MFREHEHEVTPLLRDLARCAGVQLSYRSPLDEGCYFDGTFVHCGGTMSEHDVLHEIAHALVAQPEQRDLPEFGLGSLGSGDIPRVVNFDDAWIQEFAAGLLSALLGRRYGIRNVKLGGVPLADWNQFVRHFTLTLTRWSLSTLRDGSTPRRWAWPALGLAIATMKRVTRELENLP